MMKTIRPLRMTKIAPLLLFAIISIAIIAASPAALPTPAIPTATATGIAGEIAVSWQSVAGAQFYVIGWISRSDYNRIRSSGGDWLSAFHYSTVPASRTSYTVSGLRANEEYWTLVGARTARFAGEPVSWSQWSAPVRTAGQHGEGLCPITGLPLPPGGYLSIGQRTTVLYSDAFTLTGVTRKSTISLGDNSYDPRDGRQFIKVCGTLHASPTSIGALFFAGSVYQIDTDSGIGFATPDDDVTPWPLVEPGQSTVGCQTWEIPNTATTVIVAVDNWQAGKEAFSTSLYRVALP